MTRTQRLTGAFLGALFIALHLPFLPPTLEDLDSINFALGVRHYDISQHQPHPPGYPLYIGAAKLLHAAGLSEVHALSLLGVFAGGLALLACMRLFAAMTREQGSTPFVWLAVLVVAASPLFWFTAARPLSDMTGLAASLGVQAMLVTTGGLSGLTIAAFLAAFAAGIRSQVVWLTLPLLVLAVLRLRASVRLRGRRACVRRIRGWRPRLVRAARVRFGRTGGVLEGVLQPGCGRPEWRGNACHDADGPAGDPRGAVPR